MLVHEKLDGQVSVSSCMRVHSVDMSATHGRRSMRMTGKRYTLKLPFRRHILYRDIPLKHMPVIKTPS